ncbi:hypothetical protein AVEN_244740-1 [Araneus ventricosus]|uniref:Uncharacterized protein n=1 Tax=Araneus ventricosus TaxID=182803 RepID=A0A4Y2BTH7_ARAVE|nr:hypothetical protein AVEN_244740-1 [Araneus ventricosus]
MLFPFFFWGGGGCLVIWSFLDEHAGRLKAREVGRYLEVFTDEFRYPTNFLPGEKVIGDYFHPFFFEVLRWPPHMLRLWEGTLSGMVKCPLIAVREVKSFEEESFS